MHQLESREIAASMPHLGKGSCHWLPRYVNWSNSKSEWERGMSWVEVKNKVLQFSMGDTSHPDYRDIHEFWRVLAAKMKLHGYVPDITTVVHDMEDEEKECSLSVHSEKLAVTFAILHSPGGAIIWVMKNLRVCNDCHAAIKLISKSTQREIAVRDVSRFHHFRGVHLKEGLPRFNSAAVCNFALETFCADERN